MNIEEFTSGLAEKGISLSPRQLEQFELYYDMLVEWNEKINLTSLKFSSKRRDSFFACIQFFFS